MASILILEELEQALQLWEDTNLLAEAKFQLFLQGKIEEDENYGKPLIGTEVDDFGFLQRGIKNFSSLRSALNTYIELDPTQFIPRVTTEKRPTHTTLDFSRMFVVRGITFFPFFLSKWMNYKKVFSVKTPDIIQPVSVLEQNYLSKVPYSSFIIRFQEPLRVDLMEDKNADHVHQTEEQLIIVTTDGVYMDIFSLWPSKSINDFSLTSQVRHDLAENLSKKSQTQKFVNQVNSINLGLPFVSLTIEVASGLSVVKKYNEGDNTFVTTFDSNRNPGIFDSKINGKTEQSQAYVPGDYPHAVSEILHLHRFFIDLVNGFCKVVSELPARQTVITESPASLPGTLRQSKQENKSWFSVEITDVRDVSGEEKPSVHFTSNAGGEKSAHWRRGHWRIYMNKDGSFKKEVWISEALVREDKLETENLQGSATLLKSEKS